MAYTEIGSSAGVIYDVNENARLNDLANQFNTATEQMDSEEAKKKDVKRYVIIGVSAVLILALLRIAVKNK